MQKSVAWLEKIDIKMHANSEKSSSTIKKSKSRSREIRNEHGVNDKTNDYQERDKENEKKRSTSVRTNDSDQENESNDEYDNDKMHEHTK